MTERSRRVVLLIDYDNLQICAARDTPGRDLQLTPVVQLAQRYGTVILARAYAEWNLSTERLAVYKAGIEPAFAPVLRTESDRSGKSLADTVMVAEGMDMLWTLSPEVVVLATSDKDLIPLVRVAKQRGAFVVVLGSDFTAIPLREMADEHVTYRQLITEAGLRYATEAGPGRQPAALPEPSRRRRDRNGRDRSAGVSTPASPAPAQTRTEHPTPSATSAPSPSPSVAPATPASSAATSAAAATTAGAEPVAPVSPAAQADTDSQSSSRRRRRRGSRRRSDRLGLSTSEYTPSAEGDAEGAAADVEEAAAGDLEDAAERIGEEVAGEPITDEAPITPTTSAVDVEATLGAVPAAVDEPEAAGEAVAEPAPAPVRERRRRTRRTTTTAAPEAAATADEPSATAARSVVPEVAEPSAVPQQSADIPPAPPPESASVNGTSPEGEAPAPAPARRRRVASASRGRSRRP